MIELVVVGSLGVVAMLIPLAWLRRRSTAWDWGDSTPAVILAKVRT